MHCCLITYKYILLLSIKKIFTKLARLRPRFGK